MRGLLQPRELWIFQERSQSCALRAQPDVFRRNCRTPSSKLAPLLTDDSLWSYRMYLFEDSEIYRAVLESMQNGIDLVDCSEKVGSDMVGAGENFIVTKTPWRS
jgi:hypothetical protein